MTEALRESFEDFGKLKAPKTSRLPKCQGHQGTKSSKDLRNSEDFLERKVIQNPKGSEIPRISRNSKISLSFIIVLNLS